LLTSQAAAEGSEAVIDSAARQSTQTPCLARDFGFMQPKLTPDDINYGCMRTRDLVRSNEWWARHLPAKPPRRWSDGQMPA